MYYNMCLEVFKKIDKVNKLGGKCSFHFSKTGATIFNSKGEMIGNIYTGEDWEEYNERNFNIIMQQLEVIKCELMEGVK